jgi:acyl-coenzyme A thioesterase PaaI-like protein
MEGQMSDGLWVQGTAFPDGECFGCGPRNPIGFRLRSLVRGDEVTAEWTAQPHHAANAGVLCGGVIGTLLDCHTGAAVWWWVNQRHGQWPGEEVAPGALCDGDVVYIEPNEEHWHGATAERFMAHVALQEADESGQVLTWGEHVTDDEYGAKR